MGKLVTPWIVKLTVIVYIGSFILGVFGFSLRHDAFGPVFDYSVKSLKLSILMSFLLGIGGVLLIMIDQYVSSRKWFTIGATLLAFTLVVLFPLATATSHWVVIGFLGVWIMVAFASLSFLK